MAMGEAMGMRRPILGKRGQIVRGQNETAYMQRLTTERTEQPAVGIVRQEPDVGRHRGGLLCQRIFPKRYERVMN